MRTLPRLALAVPLLAVGLGTASAAAQTGPATPLCAQAVNENHVGIVIEHGDGTVIRRCVSFTTPTIAALTVLHDSGLQYSTSGFNGSLGEAVCQIDNEPLRYSSCLPASGSYWVFFVARSTGSWTSSPRGVSTETVSDGEYVGFRYDPLTGADPPPASPAGTCPPPATPTPVPTTRATPTPRVTVPPVATVHPSPATPKGAGVTPPPLQGSTAATSNSPVPAGSGLGSSPPQGSPPTVIGVAVKARIDGPLNPALLIAVCAMAALLGLLGIQGLRRRRP